jgi:hypothetical protein
MKIMNRFDVSVWEHLGLVCVGCQFVQNIALLREASVVLVSSMYKFIIRVIFSLFNLFIFYFICKPALKGRQRIVGAAFVLSIGTNVHRYLSDMAPCRLD